MSQLDVLFVHGNASQKIYQDLATNYSAIEPPIWALLLANHVRSRNFSCELLDCEAKHLTIEQTVIQIREYNPRLVCYVVYGQQPSASTQNMQGATESAHLLKQTYPQYKIMFIGGHIAALPTETLSYNFIDFIAQNEGVYTLSDLLQTNLTSHLDRVQGLGWKNDTSHKLNPIGDIVSQDKLEVDLPGMAWDLIDIKNYRTANWHTNYGQYDASPFAALYTSLGCPYRCHFCCINIINRVEQGNHIAASDSAVFRHWTPEFTINEFDKLAALGVKNIKIADELFLTKPKHFVRLCELLKERDYGFNIWCYSRVDTAKEKYMQTLKEAGVNWIGLGIESANQVIRREVTKGRFEEVDIRDIVGLFKRYNINVGGNFIFGLRGETHETMQDTLDLAIELNVEYANLYSVMAYGGSPLYLEAQSQGIPLPATYSGYSQHSYDCLPIAGNNLTAAEILKFRDEAWYKYNLRPEYLDMLEHKFGPMAKNHIIELSKIKLKRKILGD